MSAHPPQLGPNRTIFPASFPTKQFAIRSANGLLLRGIVLNTYTYDQVVLPNSLLEPGAIYVDVFIYSGVRGSRTSIIRGCLVSQERASMHDGDIWKPRPSSQLIGGSLDANKIRNPQDLDGDHVLVGFLDDDFGSPVVLRALPHPNTDLGDEPPTEVNKPGAGRSKLLSTDSSPRLSRHHGTYFGVESDGGFVFDNSRGHEGRINSDGSEQAFSDSPAPDTTIRLRAGGTFRVVLVDDANSPISGTKSFELTATQSAVEIKFAGGPNLTLAQSGANATLQIGDGAKHVAIVEHLKTLYEELKAKLDAFDITFASHTHATTFGPSATPVPSSGVGAPAWSSSIESTKVSLPDG